MSRVPVQVSRKSPVAVVAPGGNETSDGQPLFALDIHIDLQTIDILPSQHTGDPYGVWRTNDAEVRVFRIDPMTLAQMKTFHESIGRAIRNAEATR